MLQGTLRENLDPSGQHTTAEIEDLAGRTGLLKAAMPESSASDLSVGQGNNGSILRHRNSHL